VCAGYKVSWLIHLNRHLLPSKPAFPSQSCFSSSSSTSHTSKSASIDSQSQGKSEKTESNLFGKKQLFAPPPASKGIFDSSSEDESEVGEWKWQNIGTENDGEGEKADFRYSVETLLSQSSNPLAGVESRLIYVGTGNGSISIYESGNGRRLAMLERAHSNTSVLALQQLHCLPHAIVFASHGRDGFVRFWKLSLEHSQSKKTQNTDLAASEALPGMPELENLNLQAVVTPYRSPLFVGGEGFCKIQFDLKNEFLVAYCDRGMLALWHYRSFLDHQDSHCGTIAESDLNAVLESDLAMAAPKCIVSYEGDKHGMCMSLQLCSMPSKSSLNVAKDEIFLFAGFEDGSIACWQLSEQSVESQSHSSNEVVYGWRSGDPSPQNEKQNSASDFDSFRPLRAQLVMIPTLIATLKVFDASIPVLALSVRRLDEILENQALSEPSSSTELENVGVIHVPTGSKKYGWVGVATSAEDEMVTFSLSMDDSPPKAAIMEKYRMPHSGYGDVKLREDSMMAVGGWDGRIRLFLLEAFHTSCGVEKSPTSEYHQNSILFPSSASNIGHSSRIDQTHPFIPVSFKIRELAILRYHSASVQAISLISSYDEGSSLGEDEVSDFGFEKFEADSAMGLKFNQTFGGTKASESSSAILCSSSNDHKVAVWRVF
jgi:hypothetical protein